MSGYLGSAWFAAPRIRWNFGVGTLSDIAIPGSMAELTSEWLTEALKQAGGTQHATVTGFAPAAMDQSAGVVGSIGKIDLSYAEPVSGQPEPSPAACRFAGRYSLGSCRSQCRSRLIVWRRAFRD